MVWLVLLLTLVPLVELLALSSLWAILGPVRTVGLILLTGVVGASLARREGLGVLFEMQRDLSEGRSPADRLVEAVLVVAGGLLLLTPGVFTDALGFGMMFPITRRWLAPRILKRLAKHVHVVTPQGGDTPPEPHREAPPNPFSSPFDDLP